jgi:hypothetical protein
MNAWIEFFIFLGKVFFVLIVAALVIALMYPVLSWIDKGEADKPAKLAKVYTYDRNGRLVERRMKRESRVFGQWQSRSRNDKR